MVDPDTATASWITWMFFRGLSEPTASTKSSGSWAASNDAGPRARWKSLPFGITRIVAGSIPNRSTSRSLVNEDTVVTASE